MESGGRSPPQFSPDCFFLVSVKIDEKHVGDIINVGNIGSYLERMFNKYADPREGPQVCVAGRQSPRAMLAATRNQCFHVKVYNSRLYFRYL